MSEPAIAVSRPGEGRLSQEDQITLVIDRARAKGSPLRVRLPFTLYEHGQSRGYIFVRDATWNMDIPIADVTVPMVQQLIYALGLAVVAVGAYGSERVIDVLLRELPPPPPADGTQTSEATA